jgi:dihydrofolate reductase
MKQIKANIALSLDGFIAYQDGDTSWIPYSISNIIRDEINRADILLMGLNTYNEIFEHNGYWIFKDKTSYVASRYDGNIAADESVHFFPASPVNTIMQMKEQSENDLLVIEKLRER